jgi:hypothetical protein
MSRAQSDVHKREEVERRLEQEEEDLGPMEEQVRAYEAREREREHRRRKVERKEERRKVRGLGSEGSEHYPIVVGERAVKREGECQGSRFIDRGSKLPAWGAVIDMTDLSD